MTTDTKMFCSATRTDGSVYWLLTGDAPEWLRDAVYQAHDGERPNDWRFETCADIWNILQEALHYGTDLDEVCAQAADRLTPVYTSEQLAWFQDDTSRVNWIDEALATYGQPENGGEMHMHAIALAIFSMASIIVDAYRDNT
jgi:hypothetical protein